MNEITSLYRSKLDLKTLKVRRPKDPKKTFIGGFVIGITIGLLLGLII